ncbi:MAG: hypothetical protein INQ03_22550 [Candidatus Heimdallarchaeota archaeon]|nr:hypothetical protein [Candidatus Heimdallarchaeota archaeon]
MAHTLKTSSKTLKSIKFSKTSKKTEPSLELLSEFNKHKLEALAYAKRIF